MSRILRALLLPVAFFLYSASAAAEEGIESLSLNEDIEIDILHIGTEAPVSLIWFACNQGDETAEFEVARKLSSQGYQTYFPDMLSAHFLSPTSSNIGKVPTEEVVEVVTHIIQSNVSSKIFLIGGARAAVPVVKGLSDSRIKALGNRLSGALLLTPRINRRNPVPGSEPEYVTEAGQSIHPIMVLEGERTPNRWGLPHLTQTLASSGSQVQSDLIPGVRGFYYLRSDKTEQEEEMTSQLDKIIDSNIQRLGAIKP